MRRALGAVLVAAALLTASCGGGTRENANRRAGPAPKLDGVELRGQIPGEKAEGVYRDERGRTVKDVHRLLAVGDGDRRSVLLLGRRNGTPCVGAARAGDDRVELDCFEHWENPPLFLRLVVGGTTRRRTDWLAVLGIFRDPTARVTLNSQRGFEKVPLTMRSWSDFPWQAFAAMTSGGALGNEFSAFDDNGDAVIRVDLGFSYDPSCLQNNENVCGASPAVEPWAEARDPIGGTDDSDHALVFAHPSVRRLLAGHTFLADGAIEWQRCDGSPLGSIVSFRVWPPVSFRGEIPFHADAKQGEDVAYREGLAYVEAEQISSVWVWVDAHRRRVVGIELNAFDDTAMLDEQPNVRITKLDMIEEPQPAGGPDDADQCPEHEPGD